MSWTAGVIVVNETGHQLRRDDSRCGTPSDQPPANADDDLR